MIFTLMNEMEIRDQQRENYPNMLNLLCQTDIAEKPNEWHQIHTVSI